MRLYGSLTSPYVRHCRIALAQAGIEHELLPVDYGASARLTPTQRVPFLEDGERRLTDSLSILRHIRAQQGQAFLPNIDDFDFFLLASTALDTTVNLFLLERDGLKADACAYLRRQARRIVSSLAELDARTQAHPERSQPLGSDALLRLGCFLGWALFRQRITLDDYPALQALLDHCEHQALFVETRPPA
ncbi:MAG: glutathione S-transferase family protein [Wenzhouxiangella sp.]